MMSQWLFEVRDDGGLATEAPHGSPARIGVAIVILAALTFADATPLMAFDVAPAAHPRSAPSACGADAVARAQREVNRSRPPAPTALS